MSGRVILSTFALLLFIAPAAHADTAILFSTTGASPRLGAVVERSGAETGVRVVEWRVCPPDGSACTPLPASAYEGQRCLTLTTFCQQFAVPGPTEPGTVFEAAFETDGIVTTRRTPVWRGQLTATAPPATTAAPTVGQTVTAVSGTWTGGWDAIPEIPAAPTSYIRVLVCRDTSGTDCWDLGVGPEPLPGRWAGWYMAIDEYREYWGAWSRMFRLPIPSQIPRPSPLFSRLDGPGPGQARSAWAQICCVPAPIAAAPPPAPRPAAATASVRARPQRHKGRLQVASVRCPLRCTVKLTVKGSSGTLVRSLRLQGTRSLSIPARRGELRVRVVVDGKLLASGRSRGR